MDSQEIVEYTQKLAMLEIPENEKTKFSEQISKILKFVEKLNELDTSEVKPTSHILPVKNVMKKDEVIKSLDRQEYLKLAPKHNNEFFEVPNVI